MLNVVNRKLNYRINSVTALCTVIEILPFIAIIIIIINYL